MQALTFEKIGSGSGPEPITNCGRDASRRIRDLTPPETHRAGSEWNSRWQKTRAAPSSLRRVAEGLPHGAQKEKDPPGNVTLFCGTLLRVCIEERRGREWRLGWLVAGRANEVGASAHLTELRFIEYKDPAPS